MLSRLRRYFNNLRYKISCRSILNSAPIESNPNGPYLLTLLQKRDIIPYLIAVKSFSRFGLQCDVVILQDGSIDESSKRLLKYHIRGCHVKDIDDVRSPELQKGGCWERLAFVSHLVKSKYTIQLDADTISQHPLPEVAEAVRTHTPFFLPGHRGAKFGSVALMRDKWSSSSPTHVQSHAEKKLTNFESIWPLYAEGCAGFAGYPAGSFDMSDLIQIHRTFSTELGNKWNEWGSEQFAANLLVANIPKSLMLPADKYSSFNPSFYDNRDELAFTHFYGTHRFYRGAYIECSKKQCHAGVLPKS